MIESLQIVLLLKKEDEKTIRKLYNTYKSEFFQFAKKYPIDEEEVLDIYQDAMVALCENAKKGLMDSMNCSLKTYFFAIGKYMIYAKVKNEKDKVSLGSIEDVHFEWEDVEDDKDEQLNLLKNAFSKLGEQCRQILRLFYYEEKKLDEITKLMGYENKDVAKSQKSRCLKELKSITKRQWIKNY